MSALAALWLIFIETQSNGTGPSAASIYLLIWLNTLNNLSYCQSNEYFIIETVTRMTLLTKHTFSPKAETSSFVFSTYDVEFGSQKGRMSLPALLGLGLELLPEALAYCVQR